MHSSILLFVVFMGGLEVGVGSWHPGHPSPAARERTPSGTSCHLPRAGGVCPRGEPFNYYRLWYMRSSSS